MGRDRRERVQHALAGAALLAVALLLSLLSQRSEHHSADMDGRGPTATGQCSGSVHLVFVTPCDPSADWQAEGLIHSWAQTGPEDGSGMGTLTRVAMCGAEDATVHAPPLAWHPCVSIHYTTTVSDRTSRAHALADWWVRGGGATLRADATVVLLEAHSVVMRPPRMWAQVGVANTRVAAEGEVSMRWWTAAKATMLGAPTDAAASARVDAVDASLVVLRARDWRQLAPEWALFLDALLREARAEGRTAGAELEAEAFRWAALTLHTPLAPSPSLVLSDPTDTSSTDGQPWRAVGLAPSTGSGVVRGEAMPQGWIPPASFAGRVPVVQYPRLYAIQTDGAYHAKGWSFDKRDYSTGGRWQAEGAGLLKCPPAHKRLQRPDARMAQRLWAAWREETVTSVDHGVLARLPLPERDKITARKLGGYGGTLGGGLEDRRRAWMIHVLDEYLMAAAHHYRTLTCVAYNSSKADPDPPPTAPAAAPLDSRRAAQQGSSGVQETLVTKLVAAGRLPEPRDERECKKTIAVVVTVAGDGPQGDGAAVLALSVLDAHRNSKYCVHLVAVMHPDAVRMRPQLEAIGYEIADTPAAKTFKERVVTSGCCGIKELIKLEGLTLTRYHRVLLLDMDTLMTSAMDELYELDHDLIHTRNGKGTEALQGGFLLVRPSLVHYYGVLEVMRRGDYRYDGGAWEGSRVGHNYGGETIQGVVPFYFSKYAPQGSVKVIASCVYDNMGDTDECRAMPLAEVKLMHFTVCQKPWYCLPSKLENTCRAAQGAWWERRWEIEDALGVRRSEQCNRKFAYRPMQFPGQNPALFVGVQEGCKELPEGCVKF